MKTPKFLESVQLRTTQKSIAKTIDAFQATTKETNENVNVYVGNTIKGTIPSLKSNTVKSIQYLSMDSTIASVERDIITGRSVGEVKIIALVVIEGEDKKEEHVIYETPVNVIVGNFKLKSYYSTKYNMNGTMMLKDRESTYLSVGKTARIVPALSYGVFSNVTYTSSDTTIATVSNDGLVALVTGLQPGKVTITGTATIASTQLTKSIVVDVKHGTLPVSNPKNAEQFTEEDEWEGNRVYFGQYEQDNDYANGKEPIVWRVLEVTHDSVLLLSEYGLDSRNINDYFVEATWETCTMRSWLNKKFINRAFTNEEQSVILDSKIHTPGNQEWETNGGNDTVDKVFLLSVEEATNPAYGFYSDFFSKSASRVVQNTNYATVNDGYVNKTNGNTCWWLRSRGCDSQFAYFFTNGSGTYSYYVGRRNDAIRPAIRLKLSDIAFAINEKKGGYPYIVVN